jgi:transposase InsO family protein
LTVSGNGKIERWFKTLKGECIRVTTPLSLEDARRLVAEFVDYYNHVSYCLTSLCA